MSAPQKNQSLLTMKKEREMVFEKIEIEITNDESSFHARWLDSRNDASRDTDQWALGNYTQVDEKFCVSASSWAQISKPADWRSSASPQAKRLAQGGATPWRKEIITSSDYFWER